MWQLLNGKPLRWPKGSHSKSTAVGSKYGEASLGMALLSGAVDSNKAELHGKAFLPLKVVQEAPVEVAANRKIVIKAALDSLKGTIDKFNTAGIVGGGYTIFSDYKCAVEILMDLAKDVLKGLGIEFVAHLGEFGALWCGKVAGLADAGASVVLDAQKVVALDEGEVVGEFFGPFVGDDGVAAWEWLEVVKGEG